MKKIIAVASGKGGVGKSTLAANIAVSLANFASEGNSLPKIALVDVDFYGPSIPTLFGGGQVAADENEKLIPASRYNVKYISIGFFTEKADDPIIWRGPMFGKAINQLFNDVNWGDIDICIVDMPPGTGDAQISLTQLLTVDGALIVTTPQEVALADVRRAINMFSKVNVPILGIVENMSAFITPSGEKVEIFGSGGGESLSKQYNIPMLANIPIDVRIREGGDIGEPAALDINSDLGKEFFDLSQALLVKIAEHDQTQGKVSIVN